jgi:predicted RNA-binding protein with PIN domain
MMVDGYNVIHAWGLDMRSLEDARGKLLHILDDYAGFSGEDITVVFDGCNTKEPMSETRQGLIKVVFTACGVTADTHIQRTVKSSNKMIKVVTADYLEQLSVFEAGAIRVTPEELRQLIKASREKYIKMIDRSSLSKNELQKRLALDSLDFPE